MSPRSRSAESLAPALQGPVTRPILLLAVAGAVLYVGVLLAQVAINADGVLGRPAPRNPSAVPGELAVYLALTAASLAVYVAIVARCLRHPSGRSDRVMLIGVPVLLQLWMLTVGPSFSIDVYSYIAHGATGLLPGGGDAYSTAPSAVLQSPVGQQLVRLGWIPAPGTSPYGPLWTLVEGVVARLPGDPAFGVFLFKSIEVASVLGSAALIWRILGLVNPAARLAGTVAFLWNPLVLVELAGDGHNDGLMVFFVLLGLYGTLLARPAAGLVATSLGVLVKFVPAFFALPQLVYLWRSTPDRRGLIRGVALGAVVSAVLAAVLFAPFWGPDTFSGLARSSRGGLWPGWPSISGVINAALTTVFPSLDAFATRTLVLDGLFATYLLFLSLRVRTALDLLQAAAKIALVYFYVVSAVFWPWYAVLPVALMVLLPGRRWLVLLLVCTSTSRLIAPLASGLGPEAGVPTDAWPVAVIVTVLVVLGVFVVQEVSAPHVLRTFITSMRSIGDVWRRSWGASAPNPAPPPGRATTPRAPDDASRSSTEAVARDVKIRKYDYIDSLRGFAILAVVILHVRNATQALPEPLASVALQGQRGVQLFFLVSAMTLVMSMRARMGHQARPTLDFFIRRVFRIAPMFWFAVVVYLVRDGWGARWGAPDGITPITVALTATFLHGWAPETVNGLVPGGWTIADEMAFYLLLPLLFRLLSSLTRALAAVIITAALAVVLGSIVSGVLMGQYQASSQYLVVWFVRYWFPAQLPIFAMGICLSFVIGRPVEDARSKSILAIVTASLLAIAMSFGGYSYLNPDLLYGAALALLVWGLSVVPWRIFVNRATRYLGIVSYSVYLLHFSVVDFSSRFAANLGLAGIPLFLAAFILTLAISVALASVTYRLIERPGMAVGGLIISRLERLRVAAVVPVAAE